MISNVGSTPYQPKPQEHVIELPPDYPVNVREEGKIIA